MRLCAFAQVIWALVLLTRHPSVHYALPSHCLTAEGWRQWSQKGGGSGSGNGGGKVQ